MENNLSAALTYARLGFRVAPIAPGKKWPRIDAWQLNATTDIAQITQWWTETPDHGVSIVLDHPHFVVDVDPRHGGDDTLHELINAHAFDYPLTVLSVTGGGGEHHFMRNTTGIPIGNGTLGPGIDIRGVGGQVVAPPTIHPNGQPYCWEDGHALGEFEVADAPMWMVEQLTAPVEHEPRRERSPRPVGATPRPGDVFAATHTWPEMLEADGWSLISRNRAGWEAWSGPHHNEHQGASATLYYGGSDVLKVFTPSIPGLKLNETYTKFGYLAATKYNGDLDAAARALGKELDEMYARMLSANVEETSSSSQTQRPRTMIRKVDEFDLSPTPQLIRGWFPRAEVCILAGKPGAGKGVALADIIARASRGDEMPNGDRIIRAFKSAVICLPGEDSATEWARRLVIAHALPDQVLLVETTLDDEGEEHAIGMNTILPTIEDVATAGAELVIVDSFVGLTNSAGFDTNKGEVRQVLDALSRMARHHDVTIVMIHHTRKAQGDPLDVLQGNTQIGAASRSVLIVVEERGEEGGEPDVHLFGVAKLNGSKRSAPVGFRTVGAALYHPDGQPMRDDRGDVAHIPGVQWVSDRSFTQGELIAASNATVLRSRDRDQAATEILSNGPMPSTEYMATMDDAGYSADAARRAREHVAGTMRHAGQWWTYPRSMNPAAAKQAIIELAEQTLRKEGE